MVYRYRERERESELVIIILISKSEKVKLDTYSSNGNKTELHPKSSEGVREKTKGSKSEKV